MAMTVATIGGVLPACIAAALLTAAAKARRDSGQPTKRRRPRSLWCSMPVAPPRLEARIKQFQEKFPGVQVSCRAASAMCSPADRTELADGKLALDFAFFQTVQDSELEEAERAARVQARRLRSDHPEPARSRRYLHGVCRRRHRLCLQHQPRSRGGCAEVGAGLPQAPCSGRAVAHRASIRTTTTQRCNLFHLSCRGTAGPGWTDTWPAATSSPGPAPWRAPWARARWLPRSSDDHPAMAPRRAVGVFSAEDETTVFTVTGYRSGTRRTRPPRTAFSSWAATVQLRARHPVKPLLDVPPRSDSNR